jgi:ABC-type polysaccharide/polyol phosphate transport system ATPase subunit
LPYSCASPLDNSKPQERPDHCTFGSAIQLDHVTQAFRVIQERPDTVRELLATVLRHRVNYYWLEAVRDVSFHVPRGQTLAILGRNGSGKSTLLKIIAGVYKPTMGRVQVHGTLAPLIEIGAGFHPELTGRENILLNGLLMGYSKRQMLEREAAIIEFACLGDFIDVPVKQYSSGMYMRLAFAVSTEVDPDILLLDEVLSVGDIPFQEKCMDRIKGFHRAGKTILLVTHSLECATSLCERAVLIEAGHVIADATAAEVVDAYRESCEGTSVKVRTPARTS